MIVDTNDLCGTTDIANLAGVSKQAVSNWIARHESFPKPVAEFSQGKFKLYLRSAVIEWLETPQIHTKRTIQRTVLQNVSEDDTVWV